MALSSMLTRRQFAGATVAVSLMGCSSGSGTGASRRYSGPEVTHVEVRKSDRQLLLWGSGEILKEYEVDLGFSPKGAKRFEGDGKTPEGQYFINRRNPESKFFLSLGISYPNARDRSEARLAGRDPGGDIFIHGQSAAVLPKSDWTAGCIALSNREMREIYRMVPLWTPITIRA